MPQATPGAAGGQVGGRPDLAGDQDVVPVQDGAAAGDDGGAQIAQVLGGLCTLLLATFNQPGLHLLPSGRLPIQVVIGEWPLSVPVPPAPHQVPPAGLAASQSSNQLREAALQHLYWTPRGYDGMLCLCHVWCFF